MKQQGVWLVIGVQAAGKSTIADLLARRSERAVHVRGGQFYRWAVTGWVNSRENTLEPEARRLLDLRYRLSASVADQYFDAGFTSVVQDNVFGADVVAWLSRVHARPRHLIVLRPSLECVAERDSDRQRAIGKHAYRPGEFTIAGRRRNRVPPSAVTCTVPSGATVTALGRSDRSAFTPS